METINATLATDQDIETLPDETIDGEVISRPLSAKAFKRRRGLLRIMDQVHNEIADKVNNLRELRLKSFRGDDDRYIPETKHNDHLALMIHAARQATTMPILP